MAQTMLLTASVPSSHTGSLNKESLLQRIKPKPISHLFFAPLSATSLNSASPISIVAVFKSKTKAPAKKATVTKSKPKVEDGIFGTSGGIGFTKQNELFVGRVAMLGFAASILGEALTGKGILAQLNLETGIPIYEAEPLLLFFILFNLLGAIGVLGDRGRFVDDTPGIEGAVVPPGKGFRSALGLSEGGPLFGFTKSNELFVGRLAQLGIAFSIIGEIVTGKGALAQLNIETATSFQFGENAQPKSSAHPTIVVSNVQGKSYSQPTTSSAAKVVPMRQSQKRARRVLASNLQQSIGEVPTTGSELPPTGSSLQHVRSKTPSTGSILQQGRSETPLIG